MPRQDAMSRRTGRTVIFRTIHHMRADWIVFRIPDSCPEMLLIQRARERPRLPQVACKCISHVEVLGISAVTAMECPPNRIFVFRNCYEMDVIGHEAVGANPQVKPAAALLQKVDIEKIGR